MTVSRWFTILVLMIRWRMGKLRLMLPLVVLVELFTGVGVMIGLGYLLPSVDTQSALYLATGAPTLSLLALGMALVPQVSAQDKTDGTYQYLWSLPIPRMIVLAADVTIWTLATVPGVAVALAFGAEYYSFQLHVRPLVVPAFLLVSLTANSVGFAIVHLIPQPRMIGLVTNLLIFFVFLFSPINYPASRLPAWLSTVQRFLPMEASANIVRGTLSPQFGGQLGSSFLVVGVWCAGALLASYLAVTYRR
jgi:ABC-2 type transport system permease protein